MAGKCAPAEEIWWEYDKGLAGLEHELPVDLDAKVNLVMMMMMIHLGELGGGL